MGTFGVVTLVGSVCSSGLHYQPARPHRPQGSSLFGYFKKNPGPFLNLKWWHVFTGGSCLYSCPRNRNQVQFWVSWEEGFVLSEEGERADVVLRAGGDSPDAEESESRRGGWGHGVEEADVST